MHRVLKVALQPWPTLAGMKSLIDFGIKSDLEGFVAGTVFENKKTVGTQRPDHPSFATCFFGSTG